MRFKGFIKFKLACRASLIMEEVQRFWPAAISVHAYHLILTASFRRHSEGGKMIVNSFTIIYTIYSDAAIRDPTLKDDPKSVHSKRKLYV